MCKKMCIRDRILGALSPTSVSDYLSGLLIGAEVAALRERYRATHILSLIHI